MWKSDVGLIKKYTWDERGWPARMALAGFSLGAAVGGTKMAGIASAGIGVGVPLLDFLKLAMPCCWS